MDSDSAEARLLAERADKARRIAAMSADLAAVVAASADSNADDEHDPEGSTIAFEREQLAALRSRATAYLGELDEALARLRAGRFGRCERCDQPIAEARLATLPAARRCVACAARDDR